MVAGNGDDLAFGRRSRRHDARHGAQPRQEVGRRIEPAGVALHTELAADRRHLAQHLDAKAVHDGHDDDQGADAQRNADQGEPGDHRDEAFFAARPQIAEGDQALD